MDTPQTAANLPSRNSQFVELFRQMISAVGKQDHRSVQTLRQSLLTDFAEEIEQVVYFGVDPSRVHSRNDTQVYLLFSEWLAASVFEKTYNRHKIRKYQDSDDVDHDTLRKLSEYFMKPRPQWATAELLEKCIEKCVSNMFNNHLKAMKRRGQFGSYAGLADTVSKSGLNGKRPRQRKTHANDIDPTQDTRPELPEEIYIIIPPRELPPKEKQ